MMTGIIIIIIMDLILVTTYLPMLLSHGNTNLNSAYGIS